MYFGNFVGVLSGDLDQKKIRQYAPIHGNVPRWTTGDVPVLGSDVSVDLVVVFLFNVWSVWLFGIDVESLIHVKIM